MPRSVGSVLPPELAGLLDGERLEGKVGATFLLVTASTGGEPHVAMLSVGEVLATGPSEVRLALWPGSHTTANVAATGRALLWALVPPATYRVRLACSPLPDLSVGGRPLAAFTGAVEEVLDDEVAYARMTQAMSFELTDADATLERWRAAVEALRSA